MRLLCSLRQMVPELVEGLSEPDVFAVQYYY